MTVDHVEFLVEEPSMAAFLHAVLPRALVGCTYRVHAFRGKQDLLGKLLMRLRGFARSISTDTCIVVLLDRDGDDCVHLKRHVTGIIDVAGLPASPRARERAFCRIAVEELEAWYFGDWEAVRDAYPKAPPTIAVQAKYRRPDAITGGTWEAFERVMRRGGYFRGGLQKIEAARRIGEHVDPDRNTSPSFQVFRRLLDELSG